MKPTLDRSTLRLGPWPCPVGPACFSCNFWFSSAFRERIGGSILVQGVWMRPMRYCFIIRRALFEWYLAVIGLVYDLMLTEAPEAGGSFPQEVMVR